ncbi:MAG: DMT family transporter [Alphaproteobacteria bacterium]|nr:DMT family transporter [Alphaproteobacteria bacterium]
MLFSAFIFSVGNAVIKHVSATIPSVEIVFFRSVVSLVILAPIVWRMGGLKVLKTDRPRLHIVRGLVQTLSMLMFFAGLASTPLVQANALEFTSPIFATVLAVLFFGEAVHLRRTLALLAGFAGTIIALWPNLMASNFSGIGTGQLLILAASFTWAAVLLLIRALGRTESSVSQSVYLGLVLTPVSALLSAFVWVTPRLEDLVWLITIGCTATVGQLAYVQSFRLAEMSAVLPLDFSKIIWSAMLGLILFSEVPAVLTILGGAVIFSAGAYITMREAQLSRARPVPPQLPATDFE